MITLSQRDNRWKNLKLGTGDATSTIGAFGCTVTALGMILETTPDVVNDRINNVQGYANGNLVIWAKLEEAFPGLKVKRVWSYNNADVKANVPNVLVEVDGKPIGGARHWVVYIGGGKANDPWDGKEKPTSSYPNPLSYCVIGGKWNKPSPVVTDDLIKQRADAFVAVAEELGKPADKDIVLADIRHFKELEDKLRVSNNALDEANAKFIQIQKDATDSQKKVDELTANNTSLQEALQKLQEESKKQGEDLVKLEVKVKELQETQPVSKLAVSGLLKELINRFVGR